MYSALSTLITMTEVPLSKAPNPQLLPGRRSINGCPLLRVCVNGVCVFRKIRLYLSEQAAQLLVQALVLSRLDFCNALLAGLPACTIKPLQFRVWVTILGRMSLSLFHFHVIQFNLWLSERALYLYVCISEEEAVSCDMFICSRC